jgi:hypothetical protein
MALKNDLDMAMNGVFYLNEQGKVENQIIGD